MMDSFQKSEHNRIVVVKDALQHYFDEKLNQLDVRVQNLIKNYGIITGGASASLFHNEYPKDYDVFFESESALDEFGNLLNDDNIIKDIADINPNYGVDVIVKGKLVTSHAVTFRNGIQVVLMNTANARKEFDFIHTMPWYDCYEMKYYISHAQYQSIIEKKLVNNPNSRAKISEKRKQKFIDRGWTI